MISIICPTYNELKYLPGLIEKIINYLPQSKEIIFIDGGSIDGSTELLQDIARQYDNVKYLLNRRKTVPYALNLGISEAKGEFIIRIDAHSSYAPDYFVKILETFDTSGADIVGGPTRTKFSSPTQEAIAYVISHRFGIGGSKVHEQEYKGYTDSVTFGAWRQTVFDRIGIFDERLVRNQDDEFHYRARSRGLKIYQNPEIKVWYYPRKTFFSFFKQYFQYGLYKPLVLMKIKSGLKFRHIVPATWVLYLLLMPFFWSIVNWIIFIPLLIYLLIILILALSAQKKVTVRTRVLIGFIFIHLAYGLGFISGIPKAFEKGSN